MKQTQETEYAVRQCYECGSHLISGTLEVYAITPKKNKVLITALFCRDCLHEIMDAVDPIKKVKK